MRNIGGHALLEGYFLRTLLEFDELSEVAIGVEGLVGGVVVLLTGRRGGRGGLGLERVCYVLFIEVSRSI